MCQLALDRYPLAQKSRLASGSPFSRVYNGLCSKVAYRLAQALVDQLIASYAAPPEATVLDLDHTVDPTHSQPAFNFYNNHYATHCYLPLMVFKGHTRRLVTAALRLGRRPSGRQNASILRRGLDRLRAVWPGTHILVRGDGHLANAELMAMIDEQPNNAFLFGLAGNSRLNQLGRRHLNAVGVAAEICQHLLGPPNDSLA